MAIEVSSFPLRRIGLATVLPFLPLAGCGQGGEAPAPPAPTVAASPGPASTQSPAAVAAPTNAPEKLVGEYRFAGIDGAPLDAHFGIALSVDAKQISYEPKCAGFVWDYEYRGGALSTARARGYGPTRQPDGSIVACAVGVAPEQRRLGQAIDAVTRAERTPSDGIELSGVGRSVTLFSQ
jgi:hypothetical protein